MYWRSILVVSVAAMLTQVRALEAAPLLHGPAGAVQSFQTPAAVNERRALKRNKVSKSVTNRSRALPPNPCRYGAQAKTARCRSR